MSCEAKARVGEVEACLKAEDAAESRGGRCAGRESFRLDVESKATSPAWPEESSLPEYNKVHVWPGGKGCGSQRSKANLVRSREVRQPGKPAARVRRGPRRRQLSSAPENNGSGGVGGGGKKRLEMREMSSQAQEAGVEDVSGWPVWTMRGRISRGWQCAPVVAGLMLVSGAGCRFVSCLA